MPDPGRSTDPRNANGVVRTAASTAVTAPAGTFDPLSDNGRTITAAGIPAGATIGGINPAGSAGTLSAAATTTTTGTVALGAASPTVAGYLGWSPETPAEAIVLTVASRNANVVDHNRPAANTKQNLNRAR